jgi:8-oxo-dGTP diphosphatase
MFVPSNVLQTTRDLVNMLGTTRCPLFAKFFWLIFFLTLFVVVFLDSVRGVAALLSSLPLAKSTLKLLTSSESSLTPIFYIGKHPACISILLRHHPTRFGRPTSCIHSQLSHPFQPRRRLIFLTPLSAISGGSGSEQQKVVSNNNNNNNNVTLMNTPTPTTTTISSPFPRAAVSVAVRCFYNGQVHYLLVQRGNEPNKGRWSFAGGKLEWGESTMVGAKRELMEETQFHGQDNLVWYGGGAYTTADSIIMADVKGTTTTRTGRSSSDEDGITLFHFMIGICFAELTIDTSSTLPAVTAADDAASARWWQLQEIRLLEETDITPGLLKHVERAESLYQRGGLSN